MTSPEGASHVPSQTAETPNHAHSRNVEGRETTSSPASGPSRNAGGASSR